HGLNAPRLKPILLVGEPGTGKTTLAVKIAEYFKLHATIVAVGGTGDAASLAAVTRGWNGSRPCAPFLAIHKSNFADPCIIVDEIDKAPVLGGHNGSPTGTLLSMLSSPEAFYDTCLLSNFNISRVFWIATANSLESIPDALVDCFQVFVVPRPQADHFGTVTKSMNARLARELDTIPEFLPALDEDEYNALKSFFCDNRGSLRQFDRVFRFVIGEALKREQSIPRSALC
ncbi:AAA family ATPase, partial [Pseudochrobactrum sp. sp1633]|uniref:AAA family ATPase n=1 Tax=Pseudochrobactrum sp. sp1633 TaxID=3036706 RepID=UPI0025A59BE2